MPSRKDSFLNWLRSEAGRFRHVLSGTTVLSVISTLFLLLYKTWYLPGLSLADALKRADGILFMGFLMVFHAVICAILPGAMPPPTSKIPNESLQDGSITEEAADRIHRLVMYLYFALALLYTSNAFFTFMDFGDSKQHWAQVLEILTASLLFFLYVELSYLTVTARLHSPTDAVTLTHVAVSRNAQRDKILFGGLALLLLLLSILSYQYYSASTQFIVRLIVACLSGVTLALVIGRLGSIYINPGASVLSLLYLYAVIQPFAAFFENAKFEFVVTTLALPLKVLLWLVFVWAFTTGKLWEYVQEIREFLERQDDQRTT